MTSYTWSAGSPGNANNASNWTPSAVPGASDDVIFDSTSIHDCVWDIAQIGAIDIREAFPGTVDFQVDITAIQGLKVSRAGPMFTSGARRLTFSGTPAHNSGATYILLGTSDSPFPSATERGHFTFEFAPTGRVSYDCGIYPSMEMTNGTHSADFVTPTVSGATEIKALRLRVTSGVTFAPASATPTANDRAKKWTLEDTTQSQFDIECDTFDGGYATWTFTAMASGFVLPTDGSTAYGGSTGCEFTFRKMVITTATAGHWAKVEGANTLILNDLTIEKGVAVKGDDSLGSAIHLVNRPNIKGTWGFHPIADGIYHYKSNNTVGVAGGGTGLRRITPGQIPFGSTAQKMGTDAKLTWTTASSTLRVDGKLTVTGLIDPTGMEFTAVGSNPGTDAAKTIWVNSGDSNKLYFGSSEIGGGGGGGTVDVVSNVATNTILGRNDAGSGNSEELTPAEVRTMLNVEDGADVTDATNVTAAGALMDSEVTNLAQVKAFNSADYATAAQGALADSALQDPAQFATAAQGILAESAIQTGKYEAGNTPISAKGFIDTGTDTSWIAQSAGSRAVPGAVSSGSSQVFSNGVNGLVTAWNQDLVTTQGITYSSGIWTIDTAGVYEVYAKLGFLDGDASGSNTLGNPSSSSFIQSIAQILYSSDGTDPTASEILVRGPIHLFTNGTGLSAKGPDVRTIRRFDVGDKIAIGVFNRLQSNQSSSKKYRLRSGYYNECSIRRVG